MASVLVTSSKEAVRRARLLLAGTPAENGPFSVEVEQDFFIVRLATDVKAGVSGIEVLVDVFDGSASYCASKVIDAALDVPKT